MVCAIAASATTVSVTSKPIHANISTQTTQRLMDLRELSLQSPPAMCDVVSDAAFLLRPWIQRARAARHRLAGSGIPHHDIPGTAHRGTASDDDDDVSHDDCSLAQSSSAATGTGAHH
jgi:hypothetical protein